jgi:ketosteroid isomerase-like protein
MLSEKGNAMLDTPRTTPPSPSPTPDSSASTFHRRSSTKDVLDNHLKCFGARNLKGILSDYAATAVLFTPERVLKGPDAIKPLFQRMFVEFAKPGASFTMKQMSIDGDYAYIIWSAETAENVYELGTDTFFVQNGKIVVQSFAGKITPRK